jgi:hypothetical protein
LSNIIKIKRKSELTDIFTADSLKNINKYLRFIIEYVSNIKADIAKATKHVIFFIN